MMMASICWGQQCLTRRLAKATLLNVIIRQRAQHTIAVTAAATTTSHSTTTQLCNAWRIAEQHKALLGQRTVIVTANDDKSKEISQRMWFEMQRVGIQATFITMNTPYPVIHNIQESLSLFRRTGAKSIIAIGNGAVLDFGKALRACAETAMPISHLLKFNKSISTYTQQEVIPMFCIAPVVSPISFLSSINILHVEDDILVSTRGRAPEVRIEMKLNV